MSRQFVEPTRVVMIQALMCDFTSDGIYRRVSTVCRAHTCRNDTSVDVCQVHLLSWVYIWGVCQAHTFIGLIFK